MKRTNALLFSVLLSALCLPCLAAGEIVATDTTGKTLYAVETQGSQAMTASSGALGAESDGSWSTYAILLTEIGTTGQYVGSQPTGAAAGKYTASVYEEASPGTVSLAADTRVGFGSLEWSGTALVTLAGVSSTVAGTNARVTTGLPNVAPGANGGLPTVNGSNQVAVSNFPATVSLSGGDETKIGYLTGDTYGLLNGLLTGGTAFKASALVNSPSGGGGGGSGLTPQQVANAVWDEPTTNHTVANTFGPYVTGLPAATLAAVKADALFVAALKRGQNRFSYNETTHVYQPEFNDGTPDGSPITISVATDGVITAR